MTVAMWIWMRMCHTKRMYRHSRQSNYKRKKFIFQLHLLFSDKIFKSKEKKQNNKKIWESEKTVMLLTSPLTGVYVHIVSCCVFQLSHVDRTNTSFWKPKFFTFTVPTTIDSASLMMTFSSDTFLLSNFCLFPNEIKSKKVRIFGGSHAIEGRSWRVSHLKFK